MDISNVFYKFRLDLLENNWVDIVWHGSFMEIADFPIAYSFYLEEIDVEDLFNSASQSLKEWLTSPDEFRMSSNEDSICSIEPRYYLNDVCIDKPKASLGFINSSNKSWKVLIEKGVQYKSLICILSVFIQQGRHNFKIEKSRQLFFKALNLYLMLLAIPGSNVYQIFNYILYFHALQTLQWCTKLDFINSLKFSPRNKYKRKLVSSCDDLIEKSNNCERNISMESNERETLIQSLNSLINYLIFTFKQFQFKGKEDSLILTIQMLVLITRLEVTADSVVLSSLSQNSVSSLVQSAYTALITLCSTNHGNIQETVKLILNELLPCLCITEQVEPKHLSEITTVNHTIHFLHDIIVTVKEPAYLGVTAVVKNLCLLTPNTTEERAKHIQTILKIVDILPGCLYYRIVFWFLSLCHSDNKNNRLTGIIIISKLITLNKKHLSSLNSLNESVDVLNDPTLIQDAVFSKHKYLLGTIFSRCQDISPMVKVKALATLSSLFLSKNACIKKEIESIFVTPYEDAFFLENSNFDERGFFDFQSFIKTRKECEKSGSSGILLNVNPLPGAKAVINLLEENVYHQAIFIRKSSLHVLSNICLLNEKWVNGRLLKLMVDNCRDVSVCVRKLMIQCLTDLLLKYPMNNQICNSWVEGVFPLVGDVLQERVVEVFHDVVLDNIVTHNEMRSPLHCLPWKVLSVILKLDIQNKHKLFSFTCYNLVAKKFIMHNLITKINSHIGTENNITAWFLLAALSEHMDLQNMNFVMDYFYENIYQALQVNELYSELVMEVLRLNWYTLSKMQQLTLLDNLLNSLGKFIVPLPLISRYLDICQHITEDCADSPQQGRERVKEWAGNLIKVAEKKITERTEPDCLVTDMNEDRLSHLIFTIGEAAQICPGRLKYKTVVIIQNLLLTAKKDEHSKLWQGQVGVKVKAVSVVTLGKLCLQDERLASSLVSMFMELLVMPESTDVKINSLITLSDLCTRFTSMVEKYIPDICICLRDDNFKIRKTTLMLIIELIQTEYLKVHLPLFFRILVMLGDKEKCLQEKTSSFIINSLLVKNKDILTNCFVTGIFHYTEYNNNQFSTERERQVFSLAGSNGEKQRRNIYSFMLKQMTAAQKLKVMNQLCIDILSGVAEEQVSLEGNGKALLQDALYVLGCEEIRIRLSYNFQANADSFEEETNRQLTQHLAAKEIFLSLVDKTNIIENIVPILISLKHKLNQIKSPLTKNLMVCLCQLMIDYKTKINDILSADQDLAAEIAFDLQNIDNKEHYIVSGDTQIHEEAMRVVMHNIYESSYVPSVPVEGPVVLSTSSCHPAEKNNESLLTNHEYSLTNCKSLLANHESPLTHTSPLNIHESPLTIHEPVLTNHEPSSTNHEPPVIYHESPLTVHKPLLIDYELTTLSSPKPGCSFW